MRFSTKAIRVGQDPDTDFGAVIPPIYQSATFVWESVSTPPPVDYTRVNNPNRMVLEQVLASLENGKYCTVYGSGMAAVMGAISGLVAGDNLLMASDIYGGTFRVAYQLLPKYGITVTEFDARNPESLRAAYTPQSKLAIFESPTNPNIRVNDIVAITKICKELSILSAFDNTFASPYLQNPLDLGADIVIHSMTKYISGHSDVIGGAVITNNDKIGEYQKLYIKTIGSVPSPFDCWLNLRGVKTLEVRMERHCKNAQQVAEWLEAHPKVARVHYPGLNSHPDHEIAKKQMRGFGGMIAFEITGTGEQAIRVVDSLKLFMLAESLGGVESIVGYPPVMSHATMTEEQRVAKGIPPTLIRLSIGIEDPEDQIEDLKQALATI